MTTTAEAPLTRYVSPEEEHDLLRKALDAFDRGEEEEGYGYLAQVPLIPGLAEFVIEKTGLEYSKEHFNLIKLRPEFLEKWEKREK